MGPWQITSLPPYSIIKVQESSIAYYMQKGEEGVQIACKIAYVLNGRPHRETDIDLITKLF